MGDAEDEDESEDEAEEDEDEEGYVPLSPPGQEKESSSEKEQEGNLSGTDRASAIADRIRRRRTATKQPNYNGRADELTDESEAEEPPRSRRRVGRGAANNNTGIINPMFKNRNRLNADPDPQSN